MPSVQKSLANWIAGVLSEQLDTKVEIGSVNLGFLNRAIINDLSLYDQQGAEMLKVARVSAGINYFQAIRGKIDIGTAQLFSPTVILYQDSIGGKSNFQFVIDAFSSKDKKEEKPLNLRINSLILRHANVSYDILSEPHTEIVDTINMLYAIDRNHLQLNNLGLNLSLKTLTNDSINLIVKRLSANDLNSGLAIDELSFGLDANKKRAFLRNFRLETPGSSFSIDSLRVYYPNYQQDKSFSFDPVQLKAMISPSDFQSIVPFLNTFHSTYFLTAQVEGNSNGMQLKNLTLNNPLETISLEAMGRVKLKDGDLTGGDIAINSLTASAKGIQDLLGELKIDDKIKKTVASFGSIAFTGWGSYSKESTILDGRLLTSSGNMNYTAIIDSVKNISASVKAQKFNIGALMQNQNYGAADLDFNISAKDKKLLSATGKCNVYGPAIDVQSDIDYRLNSDIHDLKFNSNIFQFNPHALSLTKDLSGDTYSGMLDAHVVGNSIDNVKGYVNLQDVRMQNDSITLSFDGLNVNVERGENGTHMNVESDFLRADIDGDLYFSTFVKEVVSMVQPHLRDLITYRGGTHKNNSNFTYSARVYPNQFVAHFLPEGMRIVSPAEVYGFFNSEIQQLDLNLRTRKIEYGGREFNNVILKCDNTIENLSASLSAIVASDESAAKINLTAVVENSVIDSNAKLQLRGNTNVNLDLNSLVSFSDSLGSKRIDVSLGKSLLTINDSVWHISPALVSVYKNGISCHNLRIDGENNSYVIVDGIASSASDNDSIVAYLNNMQIEYILDAVDFTAVSLGGKASGTIVADGLMSENPLLHANLTVDTLLFEGGPMGRAVIKGSWNNEKKAIMLDALMTQPPADGNVVGLPTGTELHGYVSPANNDIKLDINANRTNAEFLNGFLDGVFHPITGELTGFVSVVGPLNRVELIGEVDADLNLALLATNVPYKAIHQHASLKPGLFEFVDIELVDRNGHKGVVNGTVTHTNLANFKYEFDADFNQILAYDERTFNENNFYATIYADGTLQVHGSDGHPMYITANITPTRGSVFAYDSASPDAISSGSFVEIKDVTPADTAKTNVDEKSLFDFFAPTEEEQAYNFTWKKSDQKSDSIVSTRYLYKGDLYMDFNVNLNENCQIKLRMDNNSDGYITTYGRGNLTAKYHNKGTLELFGTYNIQRGNYKLYLQDFITRDLVLQQGSSVEFNGAPFDANIHLICHHLVNAVPLSDITNTTAYASNNKVKVNCILDISGKLGNMLFRFNIDVLNVSDEIKQLVRSMITTEEEMNTQIIYLLALGRFYPTNTAQAANENASTSAMNSLVSSTLSGQLNNIIGNIIGNNSNWNFGTGIVTGERGWNDLDVEGTLSGRLFDDRLLINGAFGYRDNTLTNQGTFVGDFEVKWRLRKSGGNLYLKAYNQTNDRYFTKSTLNTQGVGLSYIHDFESWKTIFKK